jgi:hypothetical protein
MFDEDAADMMNVGQSAAPKSIADMVTPWGGYSGAKKKGSKLKSETFAWVFLSPLVFPLLSSLPTSSVMLCGTVILLCLLASMHSNGRHAAVRNPDVFLKTWELKSFT